MLDPVKLGLAINSMYMTTNTTPEICYYYTFCEERTGTIRNGSVSIVETQVEHQDVLLMV